MDKTQYNLKEKVWIHIGEPSLVEGRIVDYFDLEHLKEGHNKEIEYYVIEIKTSIEPIYEVRTFDQISSTAEGPINLFKKNSIKEEKRYLKKIGIVVPNVDNVENINPETKNQEAISSKPKRRFYRKKFKSSKT